MGDYLDHPFMTLSTIVQLTLHIYPIIWIIPL